MHKRPNRIATKAKAEAFAWCAIERIRSYLVPSTKKQISKPCKARNYKKTKQAHQAHQAPP